MVALSVLDLSSINEGATPRQALANTLDLAQHAERWGYRRFWVAEHHNMRGIASAATAVVIGHVAAGTTQIRVGAGGVMLPNHAPLVIAEQFGTLAAIHGDRIDLGLGRAPGTDPMTSPALRRTRAGGVDDFPQEVLELLAYLGEAEPGQRVVAVPGHGSHVPVWILGSSLYGAQLAAALGLPYAFASHFAPQALDQALAIYREQFRPSQYLSEPYVMLGFNICVADTTAQAEFLRSSAQQSMLRLRRGMPGQLPPPVADFAATLQPAERAMLADVANCSAVGTPAAVREGIERFVARTQADELMVVAQIFDHAARLRSFELAADVAQLAAA